MGYGPMDARGLFDSLEKPATFVLANLLWLVVSIPIITLPAATAGLFAVFSPWVRGKPSEVFSDFFGAMRRHWLKSTLIGVLDAVVGGLTISNFFILRLMDLELLPFLLFQGVTLIVGLLLLVTNLYIWPLLVIFDLPLRRLLDTAFRLGLGHLPWSLVLLAGTVLLLALGLVVLPAMISLTVSFSGCALFINWGAWRIIRKYVPAEELAKLESQD